MAVKKKAASAKARKSAGVKKKTKKAAPRKKVKLVHRRPKVTIDEKLYLLFKEDYEARQVFAYLRAESVGELEQFTPHQIIDLLTKPIQNTVRRIREKLAEKYRYLSGDEEFLGRYLEEHPEA